MCKKHQAPKRVSQTHETRKSGVRGRLGNVSMPNVWHMGGNSAVKVETSMQRIQVPFGKVSLLAQSSKSVHRMMRVVMDACKDMRDDEQVILVWDETNY